MASSVPSRDHRTVISAVVGSEYNQHSSTKSTPNQSFLCRTQDVRISDISGLGNSFLHSHESATPSASSFDERHCQPATDTTSIVTAASSQAISIPPASTLLSRRDPNRIHTPLSARGDQRGHLFPFIGTPSPRDNESIYSRTRIHPSPEFDEFFPDSSRARRKSSSSSSHSHCIFTMQMESRYTPTSPLSPKLSGSYRPLSPQTSKPRTGHVRQTSRNQHMTLPRYHPSNFGHGSAATAASTVQSPVITLSRVNQPIRLDPPRSVRDRHHEFFSGVHLSSQTAASAFGQKPGSPRLDPLGSPKGPVTPLALEEASDYFAVTGSGKRSPAASPGGRSVGSDGSSNKEDPLKSKRKVDVHQ